MKFRFVNDLLYRIKWHSRKLLAVTLIPHIYKNLKRLSLFSKENNGNIAIVILCEHIGDIITCEPVSTYLKKEKGKNVVWIVRSSYKEVLSLFHDVDMVLDVGSISECAIMTKFIKNYEVHNLHMDSRGCNKYGISLHNNNKTFIFDNYFRYGSILETFSVVGNLPRLKKKPHLTLSSKDRFPELNFPFVAIQLDSNEEIKSWDTEKWEKLIASFPNIHFVEIGLTSHLSELSNCDSSYCGHLSLVDIAYLINKCKAFIGIDSSVAHYANALDKTSLIMIGKYASYEHYVPYSVWEENFYIIHVDGIVKNLPLEQVQGLVNEIIVPLI